MDHDKTADLNRATVDLRAEDLCDVEAYFWEKGCSEEASDSATGAVVPRKSNEHRNRQFDRQAYGERNAVEWLINRLKEHRRAATRYEKRTANHRAMLNLACILL